MWQYSQSTGELSHDGVVVATGYAGHGPGLNNPAMQMVHDVGPLPQGEYTIGPPESHEFMGDGVLPLWPSLTNQMFGRSGFFMHGDKIDAPGQHLASDGCIVMALPTRQQVWESGDRALTVTA